MTLTDDGLKALRGEIVLAAKASIESITRETGRGAGQGPLNPHLNHKLLTIIAHGRDALSDLDFFWGHPLLYSKEQYSSYLSASLILLKENRSPPQSYECREFGSLENFYEDFNNNDLSQGCRGTLCILGRRNRALELQESLFSLKRKVPFSTICKSGAVLFLLLAKTLFGVSSPDIYDLVQTILGEDRREQKRKISSLSNSGRLPQLSEEEVYLSGACQETPSAERPTWSTFKHNYPDIPHQCCTSSSTKKLSFPLGLPKYQTDSRHVDIHQPHSEVPTSDVHCAIWGFQSEKANPWKCIVSVSQHRFARTLKDNIHHLLRNDSDNSPHLLQNWTNCIEYIYKLGINDSRLAIREALGELESMRYSNGAKPKAASAHICLMLINFFTFYSQLSLALGEEVGTFPEDWGLASIPTWVNDIEKRCPVLADECTFVSEEAKAVRTLILEQIGLYQSGTNRILTIMASIYVPISFTATFFGMNFRQVNQPSLDIKYYFAASIPLVAITIILPLFIVPFFRFIVYHRSKNPGLRHFIHWAWIVSLLVLKLIGIFSYSLYTTSNVAMGLIMILYAIVLAKRVYQSSSPAKELIHHCWAILFWFLTLAALLVSQLLQPNVEFVPFGVYFIYVLARWGQQRRSARKQSHQDTG